MKGLRVPAIAVAATLAACNATESTDGAVIYASTCARCHGPEGKPDQMMIAKLGVRDLTSDELRKRLTVELVEHQVKFGSKNQLMPAFGGALNDVQIQSVAQYVFTKFK